MSCKWKAPTGRQCNLETGHTGSHLTPADPLVMCGAEEISGPHYCSRPQGHTESHRAYEGDVVGDGALVAVWPQEANPVRCASNEGGWSCTLDAGHGSEHRADDGVRVIASWPREAKSVRCTAAGNGMQCELWSGHGGDHSFTPVTMTELVERLENLEQTSALGAAAAGEALERTRGLQVTDILRRLNASERRLAALESTPAPVTLEAATDDRLLTAVNELTTVMRELVRQNTPTEAASTTCPAALQLSWGSGSPYPCVREAGHDGPHVDKDGDHWTVTGV